MIDRNDITGIVLAGGKSSRMGTDKGFLKLDNITFMERIIETLKPFVNEIMVVSNNDKYEQFGHKRLDDFITDAGPLAGLYTGLYHSKTEYNLVLSCDVPLVNSKILNVLFEDIDTTSEVIQLESEGKTMPLIAIYKKQCLQRCLDLLQNGERRLQVAVEQFKTKTISIDSELNQYVQNINTLEQFKALEHAIEH
ncbi:molybdopterin-guanine dinucleotide biosynthesis protein A [Flavobacteriaceae bacterium MAR_2010_105]|nr:molybdopterin-guanine dinucleotide biosynthesis protein A [Flavobacteriaceae bacterium MAR_2010_105]